MIDENSELKFELFLAIPKLLEKVDRWWVINVELPTDPQFDNLDYEERIGLNPDGSEK